MTDEQVGEEVPSRCSGCQKEMVDVGYDFAPPPQKDLKAWAVLERASKEFHPFYWNHCCRNNSEGAREGGKKPTVNTELREYECIMDMTAYGFSESNCLIVKCFGTISKS